VPPSVPRRTAGEHIEDVEFDKNDVIVNHEEDITASIGMEAGATYRKQQGKDNVRSQQLISVKGVVKKHIYPYVSTLQQPGHIVSWLCFLHLFCSIPSLNFSSISPSH
jgi:hypothetical protein